jgi:hypothetical protein
MKISGYADEGLPIEDIVHSEIAEINLRATPAELRRMSDFLTFCASEMERMGSSYDHLHLSDKFKEFRTSPHFVVMKSD